MIDDLWNNGDDSPNRRGAAWALGVLALAATVVAGVVVLMAGTPRSSSSLGLISPGGPTSPAASSVTSPAAPSTSASSASSTSSAPVVTTTLRGDGGLLAALNALRSRHGLPPVTGAVTAAAARCAADNGDASSCPGAYFWEPTTAQDGGAVVNKIASRPSGAKFLLAPGLTSVSIGWNDTNGWKCAVIAG